jgi:esterase/lipase superfamily enzyme
MNQKLVASAKTLLQTRRAVAVMSIRFVPYSHHRGFRNLDYTFLAHNLDRFEKLASRRNAEIFAIDIKRRFAVYRRVNGPSFAFEQHLLTDRLFCEVLSRILRGVLGIVNDSGRPGDVTISLFTLDDKAEIWTSAMPVKAGVLSALTLDVPLIHQLEVEHRYLGMPIVRYSHNSSGLAPRRYTASTSKGDVARIPIGYRNYKMKLSPARARSARTSRYNRFYLHAPTRRKSTSRSLIQPTGRKPTPPSSDTDAPQTITVFYGTDRKPTGDKRPRHFYGYEPDKKLHLGVVTVSMPPKRPIGKVVMTPSILKIEFRANPMKHMILKSVTQLRKDDYYERMNATMAEHGAKRAFVFVHGYNVTFEDAALRTAQLHQDLKFEGTPIFYSWPSKGTTRGYKYDEAKVGPTHLALEEFLREVVARTGAEEIHVIAHSMGNRAVTAALDRIFVASGPALPFAQLIFAAPDLDADHFEKIAAKIRGAGKRLTLYGSSKDKAIKASKTIHTAPRAGDGGSNLVVMPDVDSIDASALDTDFLSHSYISDHSLLLHDLRDLVTKNEPPDKRLFLQKRKGGGWRFQPES